MGLSLSDSEIYDDLSRKSQNFPPLVFYVLAEAVSLELGTGTEGEKKLE